jgi:DNA-binding transcriptional regulator YhcF (GntR family)
MMMIIIERTSDEPVYEQIARQVRERVASRELPAGTPLPTVRSLASDLGVNLNTVARAYWLLEDEGFVKIRERSGAEVAAPFRKPVVEREKLRQQLRRVLSQMRQAGVSSEELRRFTDREIASLTESLDK